MSSPSPYESFSSPLVLAAQGKRRRKTNNNNDETAFPGSPMTPPAKRDPLAAADMTVLVLRLDLFDSGKTNDYPVPPIPPPQQQHGRLMHPRPPIAPFGYQEPQQQQQDHCSSSEGTIAVCHVPLQPQLATVPVNPMWMQLAVVDKTTPCPYLTTSTTRAGSSSNLSNRSLTKYWNQRRRLFSRFDQGIELDEEGWFSVTPEQIADYVAAQLQSWLLTSTCTPMSSETAMMSAADNNNNQQQDTHLVVLDAFCGCGGNAISFSKQPHLALVVAIDVDRSKLRRAAHNAAIYGIPPTKLLFIECNVLFVLQYCYRHGHFCLDQPLTSPEAATALMNAMPPPVTTEVTAQGYQIGGIDLLPPKIHAIFMDPPWGGVDYEIFGKHGYDLERNMKIAKPAVAGTTACDGAVGDDFFDTFRTATHRGSSPRSNSSSRKQERRAQFNAAVDETNCVNGAELLQLAAAAVTSAQGGAVLYDVPRNTNRQSLGRAALQAGYQGNCRWDEHFLNGRLKTVTAYFGRDWSYLTQEQEPALWAPDNRNDQYSNHEAMG